MALDLARRVADRLGAIEGVVAVVLGRLAGARRGGTRLRHRPRDLLRAGEKGSIAAVDGFARRPAGFGETVSGILAAPGGTAVELSSPVERTGRLIKAAVAPCAETGRRSTGS